MGGVRGAQSYTFSGIDAVAQLGNDAVDADQSLLTESQLGVAKAAMPNKRKLPYSISIGGVNLRNAYQEGADDLPLQFQYQAADCRLFYTAGSIQDPSMIWSLAKAAVWDNKGCVSNSTGGKGSLEDRNKNKNSGGANGNGSGNGNGNGGKDKKGGCEDVRPRSVILGLVVLFSTFMAFL